MDTFVSVIAAAAGEHDGHTPFGQKTMTMIIVYGHNITRKDDRVLYYKHNKTLRGRFIEFLSFSVSSFLTSLVQHIPRLIFIPTT